MFLGLASALNTLTFNTVKEETEAWATEFRTSVSELGKLISQERDKYQSALTQQHDEQQKQLSESRTGHVKVKVLNVNEFDAVMVTLGSQTHQLTVGDATALFQDLAPATVKLSVVGTKDDRTFKDGDFVTVSPGGVAEREITLPTP